MRTVVFVLWYLLMLVHYFSYFILTRLVYVNTLRND